MEKTMNKIEESENQEEEIIKENQDQELYRITVNKTAERVLSALVDQVNDGFIGGRINRAQVANWVFLRLRESINDSLIKEIRMEYLDEVAILESILRQAKESGKVPTEFKALLQKQLETNEPSRRKTRKILTENYINDVVSSKQEQG